MRRLVGGYDAGRGWTAWLGLTVGGREARAVGGAITFLKNEASHDASRTFARGGVIFLMKFH